MSIYEIPCNTDGKKIRILDSNVTEVRVYVTIPCECPFCLDGNNIQAIKEYKQSEDQEDDHFEERLSNYFE